jgi:DNA-binding CsgD family transcriptional regulator
MSVQATALDLIGRIYAAVLDPPEWQAFVEQLSAAYDDAAVAFALQVPGVPRAGGAIYAVGFQPEYRAKFAEHVVRGLPWEKARRNQFTGGFGLASEVFPDGDVSETDFYREWMGPQGLEAACPIGHTIALHRGVPVASLNIFRRAGGGPFRQADLELGNLLAPHLDRAYRLHASQSEKTALAEAINRLPMGVILIDSQEALVLANQTVEYITKLEDGFSLIDGVPRAARESDDQVLRGLIRESIDAKTAGTLPDGSVMAISRPSGRRAFPLMVAPLLSGLPDGALHDAVAVLFISDLEASSLQRGEALRALYSLTHAEIELVELLCDGLSLEEAALHRDVTMNTARSQLKQIFAKTNTSRQGELVRLVLAGIAPIRNP